MSLTETIAAYQQRLNQALEQYLPTETTAPQRLHRAMRYAVFNGGKRIRPLLVYATGEALAIAPSQLDAIACAIECVHAYSLIHDDLPAMDDDDLRRGLPTCHKAFDEATAILAGDALQTLAFQILASEQLTHFTAEQRLAMVRALALASGSIGMAGGQALDLEATGRTLTLAELETIHRLKTGALIQASVNITALAAPELSLSKLRDLNRYAECIGLAFQVQDDILDIEAPTAVLGKRQGADISRHKSTYPQLLGLTEAKAKADELLQQGLSALAFLGEKGQLLRSIAHYIVHRTF